MILEQPPLPDEKLKLLEEAGYTFIPSGHSGLTVFRADTNRYYKAQGLDKNCNNTPSRLKQRYEGERRAHTYAQPLGFKAPAEYEVSFHYLEDGPIKFTETSAVNGISVDKIFNDQSLDEFHRCRLTICAAADSALLAMLFNDTDRRQANVLIDLEAEDAAVNHIDFEAADFGPAHYDIPWILQGNKSGTRWVAEFLRVIERQNFHEVAKTKLGSMITNKAAFEPKDYRTLYGRFQEILRFSKDTPLLHGPAL